MRVIFVIFLNFAFNSPIFGIVTYISWGGGCFLNKVAYLSNDQITGKVLVNLHSDGLAIYNNTSIKRDIEKSQICSIDKPVSTDITKFSKGSMLNEFYVPIGEDISGDFTFSIWGYVTNGYEFQFMIGSYGISPNSGNGYYIFGFQFVNQTSFMCGIGSSAYGDESELYSKSITNAWHHYALCHSNNMLYWFVDGELIRSKDISDPKYQNFITNHDLFKTYTETGNCVSWDSSSSSIVYMDDIVIIKDQCLWTEKFVPPTDVLVGNFPKYMQVLYPLANEKDRLKIY